MLDEATKLKLCDENRAAKKVRIERQSITSMTAAPTRPMSALFRASFADGKVSCEVFADQGQGTQI